jgi:hypothetical protein
MSDDDNWESASDWYQFCIERREHYEHLGEPLASLFYHAMRFWIKPGVLVDPDVPSTDLTQDEGFSGVTEYVDYKLRDLPWMYGQTEAPMSPPEKRALLRERNKQKRERKKKR